MTPEELEAEFVELLEKKELDKVRQAIRHHAAGLPPELADEAFRDACLEVVDRNAKGRDVSNVAGLLVTIGRRRVNKLRDAFEEAKDLDRIVTRRFAEGVTWAHDEVWQAKVDRAVAWVTATAEKWPASNRRRVLMMIVDAVRDGEQLEPRDIAKRIGCPANQAAVWRKRAFDGLRRAAESEGISWDEVTTVVVGVDDEDDDDMGTARGDTRREERE